MEGRGGKCLQSPCVQLGVGPCRPSPLPAGAIPLPPGVSHTGAGAPSCHKCCHSSRWLRRENGTRFPGLRVPLRSPFSGVLLSVCLPVCPSGWLAC